MGSGVTVSGNKHELFMLASIAVYSAVFSYSTYLKHMSFLSYAWDLGTFDQIMYSSVFAGKPFYYSADLFMNGSGNYLAIHFSPILALLFPIYYVAPGISTLLVIKSVAIGAAAYPLFRIARRLTGSDMAAFCIGLVYLLNPGIQGANWFDFQPVPRSSAHLCHILPAHREEVGLLLPGPDPNPDDRGARHPRSAAPPHESTDLLKTR